MKPSGAPAQVRVGRKGILGLGHADRQMAIARPLAKPQLVAYRRRHHFVGVIDALGDGFDLLRKRHVVRIKRGEIRGAAFGSCRRRRGPDPRSRPTPSAQCRHSTASHAMRRHIILAAPRLGLGIGGEMVDRHHHRQAESLARSRYGGPGWRSRLCTAATFSAPRSAGRRRRSSSARARSRPAPAASGFRPALRHLMSKKLLGPQVGAEAGFGHHIIRTAPAPSRVAMTELQPWAILAKGPPWTKAGLFSSVCTRFGCIASFNRTVIAPSALMSRAVHRASCRGYRPMTMSPSRFCRSSRSLDRHRIAMTSEATVMSKPVSRGSRSPTPPRPITDVAQRAVVHVHDPPPDTRRGVDPSSLPQ